MPMTEKIVAFYQDDEANLHLLEVPVLNGVKEVGDPIKEAVKQLGLVWAKAGQPVLVSVMEVESEYMPSRIKEMQAAWKKQIATAEQARTYKELYERFGGRPPEELVVPDAGKRRRTGGTTT